jgi:hypothetical protein
MRQLISFPLLEAVGVILGFPSFCAQQGRFFRRPDFPYPLSLPSGGDTGSGTGSPA